MAQEKYDEHSIKVLKGLDGVRKRPAMYIGDTGTNGYHHLVYELIDNATDEAVSGDATSISLVFHKDGSVSVSDNGRGIPTKDHPTEKIPTIDVVFLILHAGGKFDNTEAGAAFKTSSGTHGVGASVVNALSEWLEVKVRREGKECFRRYEKGVPTQTKLQVTTRDLSRKDTGTTVRFMADKSIFKTVSSYNRGTINKRLRELAYLNKGVEYKVTWELEKGDEVETFLSQRGIIEYIEFLSKAKKLLHSPIYVRGEEIAKCNVEMAFVYDIGFDSNTFSYANNVHTLEDGVHMNAALDALSKVLANIADSSGMMKDLDNLSICKSDVQEGLNLIVSVMLPEPQYEGQTKGKLNNEEIRKPLGDFFIEALTKELKKDRETGKLLAGKIVESIKRRDAAQKAKKLVSKKSNIDNALLSGKLSDCTSNEVEKCELFIVEGDSAGGTAKDARERTTQAVLPLKGKVMNVSRKNLNTALGNTEIASIISAIGVGVSHGECDLTRLKYHKIIISADADDDGAHICCLLFSLFYNLMRKLIEDGHLYVSDLPLYRVAMSGKTHYLKDDKALDDFKTKHPNNKMEISRFKGLGEMDVDSFSELAMKPATRSLKQITLGDCKAADEMLENLMGTEVAGRKEFLMEHLNFRDI